ncbi:aldo/keto reductase [Monoraphidium neglectum]|uniref:Aldo/keto reductase n=1 Tax=Monoraphidium neglectum TaxID=145388 RepID=A0A0D2MQE1_9CHLO|nr:aldo/keto reductase [Monoraphidium neglectum]KIZ04895.1 aldo/keto reductase [Monoraphidium neglectum]|eukprot:XP_013903914.1 aldo/keto reductase [Monoraphidium neglectum]
MAVPALLNGYGALPPPDQLPEGDIRRERPRFKAYEKARGRPIDRRCRCRCPRPNIALVEKIKGVAAAKGCTPAQLALAWVISRGSDVAPIPGTTKVARLEENVGALGVELNTADLAALEGLGAEVVGDRYDNMKGGSMGGEGLGAEVVGDNASSYHYGRK